MNQIIQEFWHDPLVQDLVSSFLNGEINIATGLLWLAIAIPFAIAGGAIGGVLLAGKDLGFRLAAMIGGLFGPAAVIPATVLGLLALRIG
ncbi:hypothetical protein H6G89_29805 [Oscillatoria sp. FACHB-1407]|uniref:hypothetical protein n=1 Tax=Oscillatoria sp. FACHB-1407 TaxID=2692847 RepID=UPI001686ECEE|nr:hypothetical protein [Oscillatoria sp. FACHB-1407]MBD2465208.1 hypothetical protein [Oscillatoria sp. FACHB-1407]